MAAKQKRRSYTAAERAAALADVGTMGVSAAARKHGVPQTSVSGWLKKAASQTSRRKSPAAASASAARSAGATKAATGTKAATASATAGTAASAKAKAGTSTEPTKAAGATATKARPVARVARSYTPSKKAEVVEHAAAHGVTAAAKKFGVSRFSIHEWLRRAKKAAKGEGPDPTSGPSQHEIEEKRDKEILREWKQHPGLGPSQIRNQLRRGGVKVAVNTVRRVMEDAGYRPPKVKREPHDQTYEAVRPNHLWHLDFVQRHINRLTTFTLILIDDYSRYVVGHGVEEGAERAAIVLSTFEEAVARHGRPERVMSDKGSAFWSWRGISRFTELLTEMGIDHLPAEHKEWNGKVEVFNANLHKELFDVKRFYDGAEMRRHLAAHLNWYNHARTHHALGGMLVPADRYYGRVDEVLARIEAGAGRDAHDLTELRDRCLELFRVTSRAGVPEVWLLGQKLLGPASPS